MAKQDDYVRYTIRVPSTVYDAVKEAAGDKSVNAEIIERLKLSQAYAGGSEAMYEQPKSLKANIAPFGLRMQPDLKAQIEAAAAANERSINSEIVARLQSTFRHCVSSSDADDAGDAGDLANALHALADRIAKLGEGA